MTTQSGCFGTARTADEVIDDLEEVSSVVDDITTKDTGGDDTASAQAAFDASKIIGQYVRRVRILTWAVVAIAIVLVLKETN